MLQYFANTGWAKLWLFCFEMQKLLAIWNQFYVCHWFKIKCLCITSGIKLLYCITWKKSLSWNSCAKYSNWLACFLFDKPLACLEIPVFSRPQFGRLIWQSVIFHRHALAHFLAAVDIQISIKTYTNPLKRSDSEASNLLKQERLTAKHKFLR